MKDPEILVVSGGAESVSSAVVEWATSMGELVSVFALGKTSLLAGAIPRENLYFSPGGSYADVLSALIEHVVVIRRCLPSPVLGFATEDDSLRLLLDAERHLGGDVLRCSRCRAVTGGGLDKAALFSMLSAAGMERYIAETQVVSSEADLARATAHLGNDLVIKPSSKLFGAGLVNGAKVHVGLDLSRGDMREERERDFEVGRDWVAQRKLKPLGGGERSACVVRDASGNVHYAEVVEWVKYPARGGSACIVETQPGSYLLNEAALAILEAVDAVGVVELSFLADDQGAPRLLELNIRPWLQAELLQKSGFDVFGDALHVLKGGALRHARVQLDSRSWLSLERLLLKLLLGDGAERRRTAVSAWRALRHRPVISVWCSRLPGVRWRWVKRMWRGARS